MKTWQKKLIKIVGPLFKKMDKVHGIDHSERVFKYCLLLAKDYRGVDKESLFVAAWLHDLGHLKLKNGKGFHGYLSADLITPIIKKAGIPKEKFNLIKQIIEMHGGKRITSREKMPTEVLIFHDADKMDSVGAIGIARQFAFSGKIGSKIWDPKIPRKPNLPYGGNLSAMHTILDWEIKKIFYTKKAMKISKKRKEYMRLFIKRFFQEWNFKK